VEQRRGAPFFAAYNGRRSGQSRYRGEQLQARSTTDALTGVKAAGDGPFLAALAAQLGFYCHDVGPKLPLIGRNSLPMTAWEDTRHLDAVLRALGTILDGTPAAASSVRRERRILNVAIKYAVRQKTLTDNPLPTGKDEDAAPRGAEAVDKRSLLNSVLAWIGARPRTGHRLHAFFATLYYAGLRPEEAVACGSAMPLCPLRAGDNCSSTPPNPRSEVPPRPGS